MIILSPTDPWPTRTAGIPLEAIGEGPKPVGPAAMPMPFPLLLNAGIGAWHNKSNGRRPTHVLCGPQARERFIEFGMYQAAGVGGVFDENEVHSINGLIVIWTVEEGMIILGDHE